MCCCNKSDICPRKHVQVQLVQLVQLGHLGY